MATNQPVWKLRANLGDASPLEYGGYLVLIDETGVYPPEGELVQEPCEGEKTYTVYRFILDKCTFVDGVLSDNEFHPDHAAWFAKDIERVAVSSDCTSLGLINDLCSDDPIARAFAYRAIGDYHGFENLDSYPLRLTKAEARERLAKWSLA
jgi:hypothetical protein